MPIVALLVGLGGLWLGEDLDRGLILGLVAWGILGVLCFVAGVVGAIVARPRWGVPVGALAVLLAGSGGLLAGNWEVGNAFNGCVQRGEMVREQLESHRLRHGEYPASLGELDPTVACGARVLRGSLLTYRREGTEGYILTFGDWLVTHWASESSAFEAQK